MKSIILLFFLAFTSIAYCDPSMGSIDDPVLSPPHSEKPSEKQGARYTKGANDHLEHSSPTESDPFPGTP